MTAKDTVMNVITKSQFHYTPQEIPRWNIEGMLECQAEVSFEAGIKEVVEWIEQYSHASMRDIFGDDWRAKLKEWGIE